MSAKTQFQRFLSHGDWKCKHGEYHSWNWVADYAEPGYSKPENGILLGNWNTTDKYDRESQTRVEVCKCMKRIADIAEQFNYEIEWEDEWSMCDDCYKIIRTSPDSYGWTPSYAFIDDSVILCKECLDPHVIIAQCIKNGEMIPDFIKLEENGYFPIKPTEEPWDYLIQSEIEAYLLKLNSLNIKKVLYQQFNSGRMIYLRARDLKKLD